MIRKMLVVAAFLIITYCGVIFGDIGSSYAADSPKAHASWWIETYGVVTSADNSFVGRADTVFRNVLSAADKRGSRLPRLLVLRAPGTPWAQTIQDGSIILTEGALKLCYSHVTPEQGDSRLAFIFGHELAHLAKDDFWHSFAYAAVKQNADEKAVRESLLKSLKETSESLRIKELQADAYGIVYMTMAGYDAKLIVSETTNFFEEWVSQITGRIAYADDKHPSSAHRAAALKAQLQDVVANMDLFTFGVRLYQAGKYDDAILLLEAFKEKFPSREVFNNIGLSHFQMATKNLAACDANLVFRFKLPTILDPISLSRRLTVREAQTAECLSGKIFQARIREAIRNFEMAAERDPMYYPARINLSSAYILLGEASKALSYTDEALLIDKYGPEALNNKALAMYLFGHASSIDTTDAALGLLKQSLQQKPRFSDALYNIMVIQSERGRTTAASVTGRQFLAVETSGPYAERAATKLSLSLLGATDKNYQSFRSPISLNVVKMKMNYQPSKAQSFLFTIGKMRGEILTWDHIKALVIDNVVELIETDNAAGLNIKEIFGIYGPPNNVIATPAGSSLIYQNAIVEVMKENVAKTIYFLSERQ